LFASKSIDAVKNVLNTLILQFSVKNILSQISFRLNFGNVKQGKVEIYSLTDDLIFHPLAYSERAL
jgi:hypothetical protein